MIFAPRCDVRGLARRHAPSADAPRPAGPARRLGRRVARCACQCLSGPDQQDGYGIPHVRAHTATSTPTSPASRSTTGTWSSGWSRSARHAARSRKCESSCAAMRPATTPSCARAAWHGCAIRAAAARPGCPKAATTAQGLPVRYDQVVAGSSIVMQVELTRRGPKGTTILTYSQSENPRSRHSGDQTSLFSRRKWVPIVFTRRQVARARISGATRSGRGAELSLRRPLGGGCGRGTPRPRCGSRTSSRRSVVTGCGRGPARGRCSGRRRTRTGGRARRRG
jgi:Penicillin amidase